MKSRKSDLVLIKIFLLIIISVTNSDVGALHSYASTSQIICNCLPFNF